MAIDACLAFGLASEQGSHTGTWDAFQAFPTGSFLIGTRVRWDRNHERWLKLMRPSSSWGPQAHGALKLMGSSSSGGRGPESGAADGRQSRRRPILTFLGIAGHFIVTGGRAIARYRD